MTPKKKVIETLQTTEKHSTSLWFSRVTIGILFTVSACLPLFFLPFTRDMYQWPKQLLLLGTVALCLCLWLMAGVIRKQLTIRHTYLDSFLLFYLIATIVSAIVSVSPAMSIFGDTVNFVLHAGIVVIPLLWFFLLVHHITSIRLWKALVMVLMATGAISSVFFLLRFVPGQLPALLQWVRVVPFNTVSGVNSLFGLYLAVISILALGNFMLRRQTMGYGVFTFVVAILSWVSLLQLGFTVPWVLLAVGLALLIIIGYLLPAHVRVVRLSFLFFLFLVSLLILFFGVPPLFKQEIPVEIALGAPASWNIATASLIANAKNFLIGSGPGTFLYDFSLFRQDSFNVLNIASSLRFYQPYSTMLAHIAEVGIIGSAALLFLILLACGGTWSAWSKTRRFKGKDAAASERSLGGEFLEPYVVAVAWIAATVGMGIAFYDVVGWWLWWTLLGLLITGLVEMQSNVIHERIVSLSVSTQHVLAVSFGVVLVCTATLGLLFLGGRYLWAEVVYTRAIGTSDVATAESLTRIAIRYRGSYVPYRLGLARTLLERARIESEATEPKADLIGGYLSDAIGEVKTVSERDPHNVDVWDTLGTLYMNAGSFTPDAQTWAEDSLQKAFALEPSNATILLRLGLLREVAGKNKEAEEFYRQAITKKVNYVEAYTVLSALLEKEKRGSEMLELYEQAWSTVQNSPELLYDAGRVLYNRQATGDVEKAEQLWVRAVQLQPDFSNALYSLGVFYEKQGKRSLAREYYQKVSALNPQNKEIQKMIQSL